MTATRRALRAQRLLLAALLATMALSALLLALLRSGRERGASGPPATAPAAGRVADELAPAGEPASPAPASQPTAHEPARAALATERVGRADVPSAEFDPGAVLGRVLHRGEPVADAELRLFAGSLDHRERRPPVQTATSDAEGRFRFRGLVPHQRMTVHAQHADFLPDEETVFPGHAGEIELERAAGMRGTVRSASGQPVAGIAVALDRWHFSAAGLEQRVIALSAADGSWSLPWAEPGIQALFVLRPGALPERREFQVGPDGGEGYEIVLHDGPVIELEVYALEDGEPLRDTELLADDVRVRTDADGRLQVPLVPLGSDDGLRLTLALPGGCVTQARVSTSQISGATGPATRGLQRIPLARGGTVSGRVLDAAGAPVSDAVVRISGGGRLPSGIGVPDDFWLNAPRRTVRSDADGRFTLAGQPPRENPVQVRAGHPEYPPGHSEPFAFAQLGQTAEVEVVLEKGATIEGHVRLDGDPAALRVFWDGERGSGWTRANDRGEYRLIGVPSGEVGLGARLDDEDEDAARPEDVTVWLEDGATSVADFDLVARRARIRGRVLDTLGTPVAEAAIVASLRAGEEEDVLGDEPSAESSDDGSFELSVPDLPGLSFDVWAESGPRHAVAEAVSPGEQNLELVLPALTPVALRVIDAVERTPVAGFHLYWRLSEDGEYERLVQGGRRLSPGADGTFLAELPAGRLDLVVSARAQGYVPARRTGLDLYAAGAPVVEFELERGIELEVEVHVPPDDDRALGQLQRGRASLASDEQWSERARGGDYFQQEIRNAQSLRVDANGMARIAALPSGTYRFFNVPKGYVFRPSEFELPPVGHHRIEVELAPAPEKKPRERGQ